MSEIIVQLNGASVSKNIFDFQNISENILNRYQNLFISNF